MTPIEKKARAMLKNLAGAIEIDEDDGEVYGHAPAGARVALGNVQYAPASLVAYLTAYPSPEQW